MRLVTAAAVASIFLVACRPSSSVDSTPTEGDVRSACYERVFQLAYVQSGKVPNIKFCSGSGQTYSAYSFRAIGEDRYEVRDCATETNPLGFTVTTNYVCQVQGKKRSSLKVVSFLPR